MGGEEREREGGRASTFLNNEGLFGGRDCGLRGGGKTHSLGCDTSRAKPVSLQRAELGVRASRGEREVYLDSERNTGVEKASLGGGWRLEAGPGLPLGLSAPLQAASWGRLKPPQLLTSTAETASGRAPEAGAGPGGPWRPSGGSGESCSPLAPCLGVAPTMGVQVGLCGPARHSRSTSCADRVTGAGVMPGLPGGLCGRRGPARSLPGRGAVTSGPRPRERPQVGSPSSQGGSARTPSCGEPGAEAWLPPQDTPGLFRHGLRTPRAAAATELCRRDRLRRGSRITQGGLSKQQKPSKIFYNEHFSKKIKGLPKYDAAEPGLRGWALHRHIPTPSS